MTMNPSTVTGAQFKANITRCAVAPLTETLPISVPMSFAGVAHLQVLVGTYTPNDDYLYLLQGLTAPVAPNFMIIRVDGPIAIACQFQKSSMVYAPTKFAFLEWAIDPANWMAGMFIDGRVGPNPGNTPMAQGQPVNYTIITGQAVIS